MAELQKTNDSQEEKNIESRETNVDTEEVKEKKSSGRKGPVTWITRFVFLLVIAIFVWYLYADRYTPYTDQARVTELVIPIVPRVSGYLTEVNVKLHSVVSWNQLLFEIDKRPYELAVQKAEANVENVAQQMGAQGASVKSAASSVGVARAQLDRAQRNYDRTQRIIKKNPGAVSQADLDRVETSLNQAIEKLSSAEANLEKTKKQLGIVGPENPQLKLAVSELEQAQLDLSFTNLYAPGSGYIESFNIDLGYYCQAGQPLATLVTKHDIWIQADYRENNITNMKPGNKVDFILDVAPGMIFSGTVRSIGYGVSSGNPVNRGGLPEISSSGSWLRDPQRFPVSITLNDEDARKLCRAGGQADVVVYTGDRTFLNTIGRFQIWVNSWLSYVR